MNKKVVQQLNSYLAYTDMADEINAHKDTVSSQSIKTSRVVLDNKLAEQWGKPKGTYITVEADTVIDDNRMEFGRVARALSEALCSLGTFTDCLIVGLGNPYLTADALGTKVSKGLLVTRHLSDTTSGVGSLSLLCPSVLGVTGIESADIIKGTIDRTKPSSIIVVDSLASASISRIATAFQVSDAGITPGSGIGNHRMTLSKATLGIPVYSIGVPLVVHASTIIKEYLSNYATSPHNPDNLNNLDAKEIQNLVVTPKDIDMLVDDCAKIISTAINLSVHPELTVEDLQKMHLC